MMARRCFQSGWVLLGLLSGLNVSAQPLPDGPVPRGFEPASLSPSGLANGRPLPSMPPTPIVQLMVLVPQDSAVKQEIPYQLKVVNSSAGRAHKVRVRLPWPEAAAAASKIEPPCAAPVQPGKELVWEFNTLEGNESRAINLVFKPADNASELSVRAYVSFEHGQKVTTRLSAPKLKVKVEAVKQVAREDWIPVRVQITNNGRVPSEGVRLTMNISEGFDFHKEDGGEPTKETPLQRVWDLGTLPPGATRPVIIRVRSRGETREAIPVGRNGSPVEKLQVLAAANSQNMAADKDEASVEVLDAKLKVVLRGDPKVASGESASYEVEIYNTGTMPLTNVRVMGSVPADCRVTNRTKDGQVSADRVEWIIPKLAPGEAESRRWRLTASTTGRRTIRSAAVVGESRGSAMKGLEEVSTVETYFQGSAILNWETKIDQTAVAVDRNGMVTIKVNNTGSEPANQVRLSIDIPKEVSFIEASPAFKRTGDRIAFEPRTVSTGKAEVFTITFKGENVGKAYFNMKLEADALGGKPLVTEKYVDVTPRR